MLPPMSWWAHFRSTHRVTSRTFLRRLSNSPLIAGLSVTIAVGVLLIVSGVSRLFLAFKMGSFKA